MNCEDFKKWLIDKDPACDLTTRAAADHMGRCEHCARLFRLDLALEDAIRKKLPVVEPSGGVLAALRMHVQAGDSRTAVLREWRKLLASCAAAAAMLLLVLYSLPGHPSGIEELGVLAVESHLSGDRRMTIRGPEEAASPAWMEKTIGVAAPPLDLGTPTLTFLGARPCKLGPVKAAYLFYDRGGRVVSVFVVGIRDLGFSPAADRPYEANHRGCEVKAWARGDVLFVEVT